MLEIILMLRHFIFPPNQSENTQNYRDVPYPTPEINQIALVLFSHSPFISETLLSLIVWCILMIETSFLNELC